MKILLLGATGRVGSQILQLLMETNHEITVLVRDKEKITIQHPSLTILTGNAINHNDLERAISKIDGVISALNTDGNQTLSKTMKLLLPLLEKNMIERFVTVGTAGILQSRVEPNTLRYLSSESKRKSTSAAADHEMAYQLVKASKLNWTIVCPTFLPDGPMTKKFRVQSNFLPIDGSSISTGDTAYFTVQEFFECQFKQTRVGICY